MTSPNVVTVEQPVRLERAPAVSDESAFCLQWAARPAANHQRNFKVPSSDAIFGRGLNVRDVVQITIKETLEQAKEQ